MQEPGDTSAEETKPEERPPESRIQELERLIEEKRGRRRRHGAGPPSCLLS